MGTNQPHRRKLHKVSSLKLAGNDAVSAASPTSSSSARSDHDIKRYTSLRDLVDHGGEGINGHFGNHTIKNRLLQHAASAYLQCSPVLADGGRGNGENLFASFRRKINRNTTVLCLCWRAYVRDPIMACVRPILRFFSLMAW